MRLSDIISGILLVLPIADLAVATPVKVQEKPQVLVDVELMSADTITTLGKRGDELGKLNMLILESGHDPDLVHQNPIVAKPEELNPGPPSSLPPSMSLPPSRPRRRPKGGWTNLKRPLVSIPEDSAGEDEAMGEEALGQSSAASLTMPDARPELVAAHALPNAKQSTGSDHLLTGMDVPLSSPVHPQPNLGPSYPRPPTKSDHEMVDLLPSGQVSSTNPDRRSMVVDSQLQNIQAASDPLKVNAKESRRISGPASEFGLGGIAQ